jgi:tripartite-type tricarboxylate transporter receptor subunit TctC
VRDSGFIAELRSRAATVSNGRVVKDADVIFLGAETIDGLARMNRLVASMKRDGGIWTVTPKGKGGVKDTDIMALAKSAGLVALKVVAFSATHSANKFVIPKAMR